MTHAFPTNNSWTDAGGNQHMEHAPGMTLRDWFAGQALIGLISHAENASYDGWSYRTGTLAGDAYAFADDMLRNRGEA